MDAFLQGGWGSGVLQQGSPERASPAGSTGARSRRQSGEATSKQQRGTNRHAAIELVFEIAQAALSLALQGKRPGLGHLKPVQAHH